MNFLSPIYFDSSPPRLRLKHRAKPSAFPCSTGGNQCKLDTNSLIYPAFLYLQCTLPRPSVEMSAAGPPIPHLTQQELSHKDKGILAGLEDWLSQAIFDPKSNMCTDKSLGEKWALLCDMDLVKEVRILPQSTISQVTNIQFTRPLYQIRRVPAPGPPKSFNPKGPPNAKAPHTMTPIRIMGNPTISGQDPEQGERVLPLTIGWTTYIFEEVKVAPSADILFITSQPL
jgi:hypothetical protein